MFSLLKNHNPCAGYAANRYALYNKMDQPVAKISFQDIERIIDRDYTLHKKPDVLAVLNQYSSDSEILDFRVWAGTLKISEGDLGKLEKNIEKANSDFRDILAFAEYPKYSDQVGFDTDQFTEAELNSIIEEDWKQYQQWLKA